MKVKAKARSFNPTLNANVETRNDMDKMVVWEAKQPPTRDLLSNCPSPVAVKTVLIVSPGNLKELPCSFPTV